MTVNESTRVTISLCLAILLLTCQIVIATALLILFKAFLNLRKKFTDYEKNLPLVRIEAPGTPMNRGNKIVKKESITKVPSPLPNRKSGNFNKQTSDPACTIDIPRTPSTSAQKTSETTRIWFTSFNTSRDSGTGSTSTERPLSAISNESHRASQESQDGNFKMATRFSCGSQGQSNKTPNYPSRETPCESGRTSSTASRGLPERLRGPQRTEYGSQSPKVSRDKPINENELQNNRPCRLLTMPIEMLDLADDGCSGQKKYKRASQLLKKMADEEAQSEEVGFSNDGYYGNDNASNRSSTSEFSKKATLASEESVSSLNSESVRLEINNNDIENSNCEEELYMNQVIVDEMRYNSVGSRGDRNSEHEEPLYTNKYDR